MTYTVTSGSQFYTIGTASTIEEAMKLYDQHLDHDPSDDACIWDENHNDVFDWFDFIGEIMDTDTAGQLAPIASTADAQTTMDGWKASGVEIPAGLTAEALQWIWNWLLEQDDDRYAECVREDDDQQTIRDAQLEKFQLAIDCAVADRDNEGKRWRAMTEDGLHSELDCHRAYTRYQQAQGFLEGLTNGIFVAGYDILSTVGSTKLTVIKKEA